MNSQLPVGEEPLIDAVGAILLISEDAAGLAEFYRAALGLPLVNEVHEGVPLHYACELAGVHFAIHPADGWPGSPSSTAQSPVIVLNTSNAELLAQRVRDAGIEATGPYDHGFAHAVTFRDPDGNLIEALQAKTQE